MGIQPDMILGEIKANLFGGDGSDDLKGGKGSDRLFGEAGDDKLKGEAGDDLLNGGDGNDELKGGKGNDFLVGVDPHDALAGRDEVDKLKGDQDADTFVLGDASQAYYDDGNADDAGLGDYALIEDFKSKEGDAIQLSGTANYELGASPFGNPHDTAIFLNSSVLDVPNELIGIIKGVNNLELSNPAFQFLG